MDKIKKTVQRAVKDLFNVDFEVELTRPEEQFGDYSTNVALQLATKMANPPSGGPREIAEAIAKHVKGQTFHIKEIEVAGPGFLNITLTDDALIELLNNKPAQSYAGKTVVAEYSDPNPFKVLHAGHLYTSIVGDAIANLLEYAGATVHRVNFGGDVGLHVARAMWAIAKNLDGENPEKLREINVENRLKWISKCYVEGTEAYESGKAKDEIIEMNKKIYEIQDQKDHDSPIAQIYWTCRHWCYEGFDDLYEKLMVHRFDKYYPESETIPSGIKLVEEGLKKG